MFPECTMRNTTSSFETSMRCASYFLVPNLHFETLKNLVWDALGDSVLRTGDYVVTTVMENSIKALFDPLSNLDFKLAWSRMIAVLKIPIVAPLTLLYGIFSSVFVYVLLMTFEFIKTYLLIATAWCLWSEVLFKEIRGGSKLASPSFMALLISFVLIGGSILLLAFDVSIWRIT
jgi:hypothetical protein